MLNFVSTYGEQNWHVFGLSSPICPPRADKHQSNYLTQDFVSIKQKKKKANKKKLYPFEIQPFSLGRAKYLLPKESSGSA